MRLIHTYKLKLEKFEPPNVPPYAILSHTWGNDEITLQDFLQGECEGKEKGFAKVHHSFHVAAQAGFNYIWIDRCCIRDVTQATMPYVSGGQRRQKERALKSLSTEVLRQNCSPSRAQSYLRWT